MILFMLATINRTLPTVTANGIVLFEYVFVIWLILAGIVAMFEGGTGVKMNLNIADVLIRAFAFIFRTTIHAIGWVIRSLLGLVPRVYREANRVFSSMGLTTPVASGLALLATLAFVVIII